MSVVSIRSATRPTGLLNRRLSVGRVDAVGIVSRPSGRPSKPPVADVVVSTAATLLNRPSWDHPPPQKRQPHSAH